MRVAFFLPLLAPAQPDCEDVSTPILMFGTDVSCADWLRENDAVGRCGIPAHEDLERPPDCDEYCETWFHEGNPMADMCPESCGYCNADTTPNLLEPAASAAAEAGYPGAYGHLVTEGNYFCLQGPLRHQVFVLSMLKSGPFGDDLHRSNTVRFGPCSVGDWPLTGWTPGPDGDTTLDHCFPPSSLKHREVMTVIEDMPELGEVPVGDLVLVMELEHETADAWTDRSSWVLSEDDPGVWTSVICNCIEGASDHTLESDCEDWSLDGRPGSFVPDDGLSCVESHFRYASRTLAALRSSSLARLYTDTRIEGLTCAERGFAEAAGDHPCYPGAVRSFQSAEDADTVAERESASLEAYAGEHSDILTGHSLEAVRSCSCLPGSPRREGLSDEDCAAPELVSPVLGYWPRESM